MTAHLLLLTLGVSGREDPVANVAATVAFAGARFTILTDALVRMERPVNTTGRGSFEDRPTLAFVNRKLKVPKFSVKRDHRSITIETVALIITYHPTAAQRESTWTVGGANDGSANDGGFTNSSLSVVVKRMSTPTVWHPGSLPASNLLGTAYSLDGVTGAVDLRCWLPSAHKGCTLAPIRLPTHTLTLSPSLLLMPNPSAHKACTSAPIRLSTRTLTRSPSS